MQSFILKYFLCGKLKPLFVDYQLEFDGIFLTFIWVATFSVFQVIPYM